MFFARSGRKRRRGESFIAARRESGTVVSTILPTLPAARVGGTRGWLVFVRTGARTACKLAQGAAISSDWIGRTHVIVQGLIDRLARARTAPRRERVPYCGQIFRSNKFFGAGQIFGPKNFLGRTDYRRQKIFLGLAARQMAIGIGLSSADAPAPLFLPRIGVRSEP
jgi:hypothetical protein